MPAEASAQQEAAIREALQLLDSLPTVVAITLRPQLPPGRVTIIVRKTWHGAPGGQRRPSFWWAATEAEGAEPREWVGRTAHRTAAAAYRAAVRTSAADERRQGAGNGHGPHDGVGDHPQLT